MTAPCPSYRTCFSCCPVFCSSPLWASNGSCERSQNRKFLAFRNDSVTIFGAFLLIGLNLVQAYTLNLSQAEAYFEEERIFLRLLAA